jgi:hypothetical protein
MWGYRGWKKCFYPGLLVLLQALGPVRQVVRYARLAGSSLRPSYMVRMRFARSRLAGPLSAVAACSSVGLLLPAPSAPAQSLVWSAPLRVSSVALSYVSCSRADLCVADAGSGGRVVTSVNPLGGAHAWKAGHLPGQPTPSGLACSPEGLCVEVARYGERFSQSALVSSDPAGGAGAWTSGGIRGAPSEGLDGVSCASSQLCVAVGQGSSVLSSIDPAGGEDAWMGWAVPSPTLGGQPLVDVSCPAVTFCAAVDNGFSLLSSSSPAGGTTAWTVTPVGSPTTTVTGLSCVAGSFCAATSEAGTVVIWTDPAAEGKPQLREVLTPYPGLSGISCPSSGLCVATGTLGDVFSSTNPAGGARTWKKADVDRHTRLTGVSCPSVSLCVATDAAGQVLVGHPPSSTQKTSGRGKKR